VATSAAGNSAAPTNEEMSRMVAQGRVYHFQVARDGSLIDEIGTPIGAKELGEYLQRRGLDRDFVFYLTVDGPDTIRNMQDTIQALASFGVTRIAVANKDPSMRVYGEALPAMADRSAALRPDSLPKRVRYKFASDTAVAAAADLVTRHLLTDHAEDQNMFGDAVWVRPGAWKWLAGDERIGKKDATLLETVGQLREGRVKLDGMVIRDGQEKAELARKLRAMVKSDGGGMVRALRSDEMSTWWVFIDHDIEEPTLVVATNGGRYRFILCFKGGTVVRLDELNGLPDP
jgi:hypothetical protein